jgi:hypothetical protein
LNKGEGGVLGQFSDLPGKYMGSFFCGHTLLFNVDIEKGPAVQIHGEPSFKKIYLKNSFGNHEIVLIVILSKVCDNHTFSVIRGMDHLALAHVDAGMPDRMSPFAEKEKIPRQQFGKVQIAGDNLSYLGLLTAGAG